MYLFTKFLPYQLNLCNQIWHSGASPWAVVCQFWIPVFTVTVRVLIIRKYFSRQCHPSHTGIPQNMFIPLKFKNSASPCPQKEKKVRFWTTVARSKIQAWELYANRRIYAPPMAQILPNHFVSTPLSKLTYFRKFRLIVSLSWQTR